MSDDQFEITREMVDELLARPWPITSLLTTIAAVQDCDREGYEAGFTSGLLLARHSPETVLLFAEHLAQEIVRSCVADEAKLAEMEHYYRHTAAVFEAVLRILPPLPKPERRPRP